MPWALVVSEYLDIALLLRRRGEPAVTARSLAEALECLENWRPRRVVVDLSFDRWAEVVSAARARYPRVAIETAEVVLDKWLAR